VDSEVIKERAVSDVNIWILASAYFIT